MLGVRLALRVVVVKHLVDLFVSAHSHFPFLGEDALFQRQTFLPLRLIGAFASWSLLLDDSEVFWVNSAILLLRQLGVTLVHVLIGLVAYHALNFTDWDIIEVAHDLLVLIQDHFLCWNRLGLCLVDSQLIWKRGLLLVELTLRLLVISLIFVFIL